MDIRLANNKITRSIFTKSGLDSDSFEVDELSNNIQFQQWRNTSARYRLFMTYNWIWARRSRGNGSSSSVMQNKFLKISKKNTALTVVLVYLGSRLQTQRRSLHPGFFVDVFPPAPCPIPSKPLLKKGISYLFLWIYSNTSVSHSVNQLKHNRKLRKGGNIRMAKKFVH